MSGGTLRRLLWEILYSIRLVIPLVFRLEDLKWIGILVVITWRLHNNLLFLILWRALSLFMVLFIFNDLPLLLHSSLFGLHLLSHLVLELDLMVNFLLNQIDCAEGNLSFLLVLSATLHGVKTPRVSFVGLNMISAANSLHLIGYFVVLVE
jgi:hypothetical protein